MVTDLIKIPCIPNLLFRDHIHSYPETILNITSQNIILTHKQLNRERWVNERARESERERKGFE